MATLINITACLLACSYRNMFTRDEITWNLRDSHFLEALQLVEQHLGRLQQRKEAAAEGAGGGGAARPKLVSIKNWRVCVLFTF